MTTNDTIQEWQLQTQFDDMLDETYESVNICGHDYTPSYALKSVDPIAYRESFLAYADSVERDGTTIEWSA